MKGNNYMYLLDEHVLGSGKHVVGYQPASSRQGDSYKANAVQHARK